MKKLSIEYLKSNWKENGSYKGITFNLYFFSFSITLWIRAKENKTAAKSGLYFNFNKL